MLVAFSLTPHRFLIRSHTHTLAVSFIHSFSRSLVLPGACCLTHSSVRRSLSRLHARTRSLSRLHAYTRSLSRLHAYTRSLSRSYAFALIERPIWKGNIGMQPTEYKSRPSRIIEARSRPAIPSNAPTRSLTRGPAGCLRIPDRGVSRIRYRGVSRASRVSPAF